MYAAAPGMMMVPVPPHLQAGYHEMHMVGSPTAPPPAMWAAMPEDAYGAAPLSPHGSPHARAAAEYAAGFGAGPPVIPALEQGSPRGGGGGGGAPFDAAAGLLIDCERVNVGADERTTIMIRNIPNKYTPDLVLEEINVLFQNEYGARPAVARAPPGRAQHRVLTSCGPSASRLALSRQTSSTSRETSARRRTSATPSSIFASPARSCGFTKRSTGASGATPTRPRCAPSRTHVYKDGRQ